MSPANRRRSLAVSSIVAAGVAIFLAPQAATAEESDPLPIVDGHVDWGIKESFRNYVTGPIAGGDISVNDGAEEHNDGTFQFPDATGEYFLDSHNVDVEAEGSIHFSGHSGSLDLTFDNVRVNTDHAEATGEVIVDIVSSGNEYLDTHFADLDLDGLEWERGELTSIADIPAVLTEDGADAMVANINGDETRLYEAGEDLDPVSVAVAAEVPGESPGNGDDNNNDDPSNETENNNSEPDGPLTIVDGHMDWGFKDSFRSYVTGPIASGEISTSGGAENHGDYFTFPDASGAFDADAGDIEADFTGDVNFYGHSGSLDVTFTDLSLVGDSSGLQIYTNGVPIAVVDASTADASGDQLVVDNASTTLTAEGAELMVADVDGDEVRFYEPGDELDPVSVALAFDESVNLPPSGNDRLPVTGSTLTWALAGGAALLVAGSLALVVTRRRSMTV